VQHQFCVMRGAADTKLLATLDLYDIRVLSASRVLHVSCGWLSTLCVMRHSFGLMLSCLWFVVGKLSYGHLKVPRCPHDGGYGLLWIGLQAEGSGTAAVGWVGGWVKCAGQRGWVGRCMCG
jgi:hypothetical protein